MIEITEKPIYPELIVNKIKTDSSGCVVTYVGLMGNINLVVAVASAHRQEGVAVCQYAIDQFKQKLPTQKKETYEDGSIWVEGE